MCISSTNSHKTLIVHLGNEDFKKLVGYAKFNRDCYESELGFSNFALFSWRTS